MSALLDWVEKAALENLKFRLQNSETLAKEANATLTILLAGIGAALAYCIKGYEQASFTPLVVGVAAIATWLTLIAVVLVYFCMLSMSLPVPTNEPKLLYQKEYELDALREVELRNIQQRIDQAAARNHRIAAWLDRCRVSVLITPIIFFIVAWVWAVR